MSCTKVRYLDGTSVHVRSETVGGVMVHFANLHQRFASDIAVVCPDTGRDLTDPPSQVPPPMMQIVVKPEEAKNPTIEKLVFTFDLHAQYKDPATSACAYKLLLELYNWDSRRTDLFHMLDKVAADNSDVEATFVRAFVHAGIDLHFVLQDACSIGNESRVKALLSQGVPIEFEGSEDDEIMGKCQPLCSAAVSGKTGIVEILIAQRASLNVDCMMYNISGTPLIFASSFGHAETLRMLLNHRAEVDQISICFSALGQACRYARINIAKILLSHRADPNLVFGPCGSEFALMHAVTTNKPDIVRLLLEHKAYPNLKDTVLGTVLYRTLLFARDQQSSLEIVKMLIHYQADVIGQGSQANGALFLAAKRTLPDIAKVLLDNGADVNGRFNCETPLMGAISRGCINVVKVLLESKAHVNQQSGDGKSALALALEKNDATLVEILQHHIMTSRTSSNEVFACKRKGESEDSSAASAGKRRKSTEDDTREKKTCSSGNDIVEEKEKQNHSSTTGDSKNKQVTIEGCGSYASTSKDQKTLDEE